MSKFGSLLTDHPDVLKQSNTYPYIDTNTWWNHKSNLKNKIIPDIFDGRNIWEAYLQFPSNQKCSDSWAIVATDILADRITISTVAQVNIYPSSLEVVSCIDKPPHPKIDGVISGINLDFTDSCQGYSIYDAWEYLYQYGVSEINCFSENKLTASSFKLPNDLSFKQKIESYGKQCSNVEGNQLFCLTLKDNKPIARRSFFINAIFNLKGIETIKYELLRFGPVAAGFIVYENFINNYDGKTIYEKAEGKPLGGHYISIIGWENDVWICRNSWGTQWGLLGFFKMKMGIKECQLENNVSSIAPFYYLLSEDQRLVDDGMWNGKLVDVTEMKLFNEPLWNSRNTFKIDPYTFYPKQSIEKIKKGELYGDLSPLISNPNDLPQQDIYWAKDFKLFKFETEIFIEKKESYFWIIIIIIISLLFGFIRN